MFCKEVNTELIASRHSQYSLFGYLLYQRLCNADKLLVKVKVKVT